MQNATLALFGSTDAELLRAYPHLHHPEPRIRLDLRLYWLIDEKLLEGFHTFVTGLRPGIDLLLAAYVLDCRRALPEKRIRLIAVLPGKKPLTLTAPQRRVLKRADFIHHAPATTKAQTQAMLALATHAFLLYPASAAPAPATHAIASNAHPLRLPLEYLLPDLPTDPDPTLCPLPP